MVFPLSTPLILPHVSKVAMVKDFMQKEKTLGNPTELKGLIELA